MTDHSPANRDKLRKAGLSMQSDLEPDQVARLDAADPEMGAAALREQILRGVRTMTHAAERPPTAAEHAVEHLREHGAMHYRDLADALVKSGKVTPRGKTFAQTLSAELSRRNGQDVERVAPGVYAAKKEDNDDG